MTIAQANKIADRILSLPQLYDSPPYLVYPWVRTAPQKVDKNNEGNIVTYSPDHGFANGEYNTTITDWATTGIWDLSLPIGTSVLGGTITPRYITIDDLRMMPYIGLEYARAKLRGWRYRYTSQNSYPAGCIVRVKNGLRYIHSNDTDDAGPTPSADSASSVFWTSMMRKPGFDTLKIYGFDYPDDFEMPTEAFSGLVQLGSIVGENDLVKFGIERSTTSYAEGGDVWKPCVESGSMEIILTLDNLLTENNIENSVTVFQQNSYPIYYGWDDQKAKEKGYPPTRTLSVPGYTNVYSKLAVIDCNGSYVPLKKGVIYNVYALFNNAILAKYENKKLVTYSRLATRLLAPYFGKSEDIQLVQN